MKALQLAELVQNLSDRSEIADLVSRLGVWLDKKQFEDPSITAALLTPDVTVRTPGGTSEGIEAATMLARKNHKEPRTQHLHTNVVIDLAGDTADVECNLQVTRVPNADEPHVFSQAGTRYAFTVVRTAEGWRFASIQDQLIWRRPIGQP